MEEKHLTLKSSGQNLDAIFHSPAIPNSPAVVICHGRGSNKDKPGWLEVARKFCKEGYSVLRFDFRGHGKSEGSYDKLTDDMLIEDVASAIDFLFKQDSINNSKIGIIGSSLGGRIAILTAASDKRIKCLATWAAPYQSRKLNTYSALDSISKVNIPVLLIHGDEDDVVDVSQAKKLFEMANDPKELKIIHGANHFLKGTLEVINLTLDWFSKWLK